MTQRVLVLHTDHVAEVVDYLRELGLDFKMERHGRGPIHFACEANGKVFEVYPARRAGDEVQFMEV